MTCRSSTNSLNMTVRTLQIIAVIVALASASACSNRRIYEASHQNRLQECEKIAASQRQTCKAEYSESYDEYRRRLEAEK